jgi:hypothetical protein
MERDHGSNELLYRLPKNEAFLFRNDQFTPLPELSQKDFLEYPIFLMHDHKEAGRVWKKAFELGVIGKNLSLLHIDAHDDLALRNPFPDGEPQNESFILPLVEKGLIRDITWVCNHPNAPVDFEPDAHSVTVPYPYSLTHPSLTKRPIVSEVGKLTDIQAFDLLDIDLNFFTEDVNQNVPDFWLRWRTRKSMEETMRLVSDVKVTTITVSPGFIQNGRAQALVEEALKAFGKKA